MVYCQSTNDEKEGERMKRRGSGILSDMLRQSDLVLFALAIHSVLCIQVKTVSFLKINFTMPWNLSLMLMR